MKEIKNEQTIIKQTFNLDSKFPHESGCFEELDCFVLIDVDTDPHIQVNTRAVGTKNIKFLSNGNFC